MLGTARMALQVSHASRMPLYPTNQSEMSSQYLFEIPVGITYSVPSGARFRAKVLIDIGKPIEVTDELLKMYKADDRAKNYKLSNR